MYAEHDHHQTWDGKDWDARLGSLSNEKGSRVTDSGHASIRDKCQGGIALEALHNLTKPITASSQESSQ